MLAHWCWSYLVHDICSLLRVPDWAHIARDSTGSRLLEAALESAPTDLTQRMVDMFKGSAVVVRACMRFEIVVWARAVIP